MGFLVRCGGFGWCGVVVVAGWWRCGGWVMCVYLTIVFVGAVRVAVECARLSVCGPACVRDAKVHVQLLLQIHRVFF